MRPGTTRIKTNARTYKCLLCGNKRFSHKYKDRITTHPNPLANTYMDNTKKRLKKTLPQDLITHLLIK